jgi:hypothetical protein
MTPQAKGRRCCTLEVSDTKGSKALEALGESGSLTKSATTREFSMRRLSLSDTNLARACA